MTEVKVPRTEIERSRRATSTLDGASFRRVWGSDDARTAREEAPWVCGTMVSVNRLGNATSPYLLQHQDNPVDWWEWGPEALAVAQQLDQPILLSVGYAACHWCHVMAHESFEDEATAEFMNTHFINIKVDREERPDIDAVYMRATQAMTGQGGWPMTCALTPSGEPFFAGTYFPDQPRAGLPSFQQVLSSLADAWQNRRDEISKIGGQLVSHLQQQTIPAGEALSQAELDQAVEMLYSQFDGTHGGFGTAPKFPPSMALEFLLRAEERRHESFPMVDATLQAMARGGMYDQLGGGFARYSVDASWTVPHFEKMLYDNALLLTAYTHASIARPGLAGRVASETAEFILSELSTGQGGFASALDADSEGYEGTYYVWGLSQLRAALGDQDAAWVAELCSVTRAGTFERGLSTLQLPRDPDDQPRWERVRARLRELRTRRERPARDDKVIASWNGLAISALTYAGVVLDRSDWIQAAVDAAQLLVDVHMDAGGGLRRSSRDGVAGHSAGVLEDYGAVASAFLDVYSSTGDIVWFDRAELLLRYGVDQFTDPDGGFFDTAAGAEVLIARPREVADNAHPSGTSAILHAFIKMHALTGDSQWRAYAEDALTSVSEVARKEPRFAGWVLAAAEALLAGPVQIAVIGPADSRAELYRAAVRLPGPGSVVVGSPEAGRPALVADRAVIEGKPSAYVCRGFVCRQPVTAIEDLSLG